MVIFSDGHHINIAMPSLCHIILTMSSILTCYYRVKNAMSAPCHLLPHHQHFASMPCHILSHHQIPRQHHVTSPIFNINTMSHIATSPIFHINSMLCISTSLMFHISTMLPIATSPIFRINTMSTPSQCQIPSMLWGCEIFYKVVHTLTTLAHPLPTLKNPHPIYLLIEKWELHACSL